MDLNDDDYDIDDLYDDGDEVDGALDAFGEEFVRHLRRDARRRRL